MSGSHGAGLKYALFSYSTVNLGDEIQSIAARQFLPSIDLLVDRDKPDELPKDTQGPFRIILNGWHSCFPQHWPPSPELTPLPVSLHITNEISGLNPDGRRPSEALLEGKNLDYLRSIAPIGARDFWTLQLLQDKGVEAYFSGCLTLTLGSGESRQRQDYICGVDLRPDALDALRARHNGPVVVTTHRDRSTVGFDTRVAEAERLLTLYANARCVVTTRLHCALPCLALGTPVLLVLSAKDMYRFTGLRDLLHVCTPEAFVQNQYDFDTNHPPPNSTAFQLYRDALITRALAFTQIGSANWFAPNIALRHSTRLE